MICSWLEFDARVLKRLRADYNIGSEDTDDIAFVGQRIRWIKGNGATAPHIQVDQQLAVDDLHEIVFERSLKDEILCTPFLHTEYRSVLSMIIGCSHEPSFRLVIGFRVLPLGRHLQT